MNWSKIINTKCCQVNIHGNNKKEMLEALVDLASNNSELSHINEEELLSLLTQREELLSTGIGSEIAIPHAQIAGLEQFIVCVATRPGGIDFEAIDKNNSKLFFLILGPKEKETQHLRILATLSRIASVHENLEQLVSCESNEILHKTILEMVGATPKASSSELVYKELNLFIKQKTLLDRILEILIANDVQDSVVIETTSAKNFSFSAPLFIGFADHSQGVEKQYYIKALVAEEVIEDILSQIEKTAAYLGVYDSLAWSVTAIERFKRSIPHK